MLRRFCLVLLSFALCFAPTVRESPADAADAGWQTRATVAEKPARAAKVTAAFFAESPETASGKDDSKKTELVPVPKPLRSETVPSDTQGEAARSPPPLMPPAQATIITEGDAAFLDSGEPVPQGYSPEGPVMSGDGLMPMPETPATAPERIFARAEYLLWWTKGMHLPPLVTTSPLGTPQDQAGVLGAPNTTILFGNDKVLDGDRDGMRLRIGGWLGPRHRLGIEGEYLAIASDSLVYRAGSNGRRILARPFTNVDPALGAAQGPDAALTSFLDPAGIDGIAGCVEVDAASRFRAAGLHLRCNMAYRDSNPFDPYGNPAGRSGYRLDLISGYRCLRLEENLAINELLTLSVNPQAGQEVSDRFDTDNNFQGGELGLYGEWHRGRLALDGVARLALGRTEQRVDIAGRTRLSTVGIVTELPGGLLALTTNAGTYRRKDTDIVPEVGLTLAYLLSPRLKLTCGYALIYWPHVVRPGEQIDLTVNGSYIPDPNVIPSGPTRPSFVFHDTSYWAHGMNIGLDYRW
jgi:hypothetical protein